MGHHETLWRWELGISFCVDFEVQQGVGSPKPKENFGTPMVVMGNTAKM